MIEKLMSAYKTYKDKKNSFEIALNTLYFDIATIAPKDGIPYRNKMISILAGEAFVHETDNVNIAMIEELAQQKEIDDQLKKELTLLLRDLNDIRVLPKDVYVAFTLAKADSQHAWEIAKEKNDYQLFKPHLIEVIKKQKEVLGYIHKDCSDYDYLLDRYQMGTNTTFYDTFFEKIKTQLIPFIKQLQEHETQLSDHPLLVAFDVEKQKSFMNILMKHLQVDTKKCFITTSEHPFTQFFSSNEARITTKYHEDNIMSAIFSTIHEFGHANYALHIDPSFEGTALAQDIGFAMHESQSRFMENHIGRNPSFWIPLYPELQKLFPEQLSSISFESFMDMMNVTRSSFIRTEADELTYPVHILIRYELEKAIFNDLIDYEQLDTMWNDKYEEYLGIRPEDDRNGILQDMHWGAADLGYFPTYALGSAFAAQFYHQMEKELDIHKILLHGNFKQIYDWLSEHIQQYGAYKSAEDIIKDATHEPFDVNYYITYLKNKYQILYHMV